MFPTSVTKEKMSNQTLIPRRRVIEEKCFEKMDLDTLFAIFYFQRVKINESMEIAYYYYRAHMISSCLQKS